MHTRNMLLTALLLTWPLSTSSTLAQDVGFTAAPNPADAGAPVTVTWTVPAEFTSVYLSTVGIVANTGSKTLHLTETSTLVIAAEGPFAALVRPLRVRVTGARGDNAGFPDQDAGFRNPLRWEIQRGHLVKAISAIYAALEGEGHAVQPLLESDGRFRCVTNYRVSAAAQKNLNRTFQNRRVAYLIELAAPTKNASSAVGSIRIVLEAKKWAEGRYVPEPPSDLDQELCLRVRELIAKSL